MNDERDRAHSWPKGRNQAHAIVLFSLLFSVYLLTFTVSLLSIFVTRSREVQL